MKKPLSIGIASLMTAQLVGPVAKAQFEDFPPPPPPPDFGGGSPDTIPDRSGGIRGGAPAGANKANGTADVLSKNVKDKFSKAQIEDITSENFPETIESFDFPNVEITDVIKAISELTGKNFIIDPSVRGKITIVAPSKITVAEAYKAFLSSLAISGLDRKSTRLNSSHTDISRMPSSA